MVKQTLIIILILIFSGLPQAFAQSFGAAAIASDDLDLEKIYFENIQSEAPADSLSSKLTPELQQRLGILPGGIRTFVQDKIVPIKGVNYTTTTEYIQGDLTLNQLIEVLSVMQNDLLKMLLENPKLKFRVKVLENGRRVAKDLPVQFFISLLKSANRLDYNKIQMDNVLKNAIETDKKFRKYVNSHFDKSVELYDDGTKFGREIENFSPNVSLSGKDKISFALIRFSGILAIPYSATYVIPPSLGIVLTDIPDLNVFLITQLFVASASLGLQIIMNPLAKWMTNGFPNFNGYTLGNSKMLEYKRWWLLEGAFLALIPSIHAALGVYPEMPIIEYAMKAMFQTALISTATQGLWDLYLIDKRNKELVIARADDEALRQIRIDRLGPKAFKGWKPQDIEEYLHPEEIKVIKRFNRNMVINSIVSVSLGSMQITAMAAGLEGVVTATFWGYGAYAIGALYKIAKENASTPKTLEEIEYLEVLRMVRTGNPNQSLLNRLQANSYISAIQILNGVQTAAKALYEFFINKYIIILKNRREAAKLEAARKEREQRPYKPVIQIFNCQALFG